MAQVPIFFSILTLTFTLKVKLLEFYLIFEFLVNGERGQTLLLPSNMTSYLSVRLAHLYFTLANYKGDGQGHTHFGC